MTARPVTGGMPPVTNGSRTVLLLLSLPGDREATSPLFDLGRAHLRLPESGSTRPSLLGLTPIATPTSFDLTRTVSSTSISKFPGLRHQKGQMRHSSCILRTQGRTRDDASTNSSPESLREASHTGKDTFKSQHPSLLIRRVSSPNPALSAARAWLFPSLGTPAFPK